MFVCFIEGVFTLICLLQLVTSESYQLSFDSTNTTATYNEESNTWVIAPDTSFQCGCTYTDVPTKAAIAVVSILSVFHLVL